MDPELDRPLIHIGYHKTGTSWLQTHLFGRDDRGFFPVLAPEDPVPSRRKQVAKSFGRRFLFESDGGYLAPLAFEEQVVREAARRVASQPGVPVISSERLSGYPHGGGFDSKELADRIHRVFPAARIFLVIREQRSMILSGYYNYLKAGGTRSLPGYLHTPYDGRRPVFSPSYYEYHRLLSLYRDLFGAENVLALPYELFRDDPRDFVARLARFAGARVPLDELPFATVENLGANRWAMYATRQLGALLPARVPGARPALPLRAWRGAIKLLRRGLGRLAPTAWSRALLERQRAQIERLVASRYAASNLETSKLIGLDLASYGYRCGAQARPRPG